MNTSCGQKGDQMIDKIIQYCKDNDCEITFFPNGEIGLYQVGGGSQRLYTLKQFKEKIDKYLYSSKYFWTKEA